MTAPVPPLSAEEYASARELRVSAETLTIMCREDLREEECSVSNKTRSRLSRPLRRLVREPGARARRRAPGVGGRAGCGG